MAFLLTVVLVSLVGTAQALGGYVSQIFILKGEWLISMLPTILFRWRYSWPWRIPRDR